MPEVFRASDYAAVIGMILFLTYQMGPGILAETTAGEQTAAISADANYLCTER